MAVVVFPLPQEIKVGAAKRFKEMGKEVLADAEEALITTHRKEMEDTMEIVSE